MRLHLIFTCITVLILGSQAHGQAPDSVFVLRQSQIDSSGYLRFPPLIKWKFKKGNNPDWAAADYDDSQWVQMDSTQIMDLRYDDNHLFEGWFRIKVRLEPGFKEVPRFTYLASHAAADVYLNGELAASFGATGTTSEDFRRKKFYLKYLPLEEAQTYTFAVHYVDRVGPVSQFFSKDRGVLEPVKLLALTTLSVEEKRLLSFRDALSDAIFIFGLLCTACLIIWIIWALNRKENHLLYLAMVSTTLLWYPFRFIITYEPELRAGLLFNEEWYATSMIVEVYDGALPAVLIPWLLVSLFVGKVPKWLRISGWIILLVIAPMVILQVGEWVRFLPSIVIFGGALLGVFYLVRYRKNIVGVRWILVIGLGFTIVFYPLLAFLFGLFPFLDFRSFIFLIPLTFVVYLAAWIRETQRNERKKANELVRVSLENQQILENQNITLESEVKKRTKELSASYENLKSTQAQLIHAEKMASLGELTAGIAHEIKNPLNFVNNFSEVSRELLEEMKEELKKGDTEEADLIATDVIQNLEKIVHHGQRADSIVRGMLQHSRSGDGKKESTDLNALADEYLRLAYHGLRAKDKSFNAAMETDFDPDLPELKVVPQDIGRVLLNLLTNAFHAVSERNRKEPEGYEPTVWVQTRKTDAGVELSVRDNGLGIPDAIKDKIFQPFFTTKPTGEGTGLGLSMSYDIVTKGHGGQLTLKSNTGEGTEFLITLPA